jgi:cystathionine beta-lyase
MSATAQDEFEIMVAGLTERTLLTQRSMKWGAIPPDVLPAWVAQMDFTPPACIRTALKAQIDHDDTGYADKGSLGDAIAGWVKRYYDWNIVPAWVLLVPDLDFALAAAQGA